MATLEPGQILPFYDVEPQAGDCRLITLEDDKVRVERYQEFRGSLTWRRVGNDQDLPLGLKRVCRLHGWTPKTAPPSMLALALAYRNLTRATLQLQRTLENGHVDHA